ncbi:hypothetical protein F4604DRAFT_1932048 [Suillus subluteus]|nr:hypothetical protein F4604DRAFT_1932048 [Suillus subluteus]
MYPQLPNILRMLANFSLPLEPSRFILPAYFNIYAFMSFVFHCPLYVHGVVSFFHTATFKRLQESGHYPISNAKIPKQISLSTPPLNPACPSSTKGSNDTLTIQTSSKARQLLHHYDICVPTALLAKAKKRPSMTLNTMLLLNKLKRKPCNRSQDVPPNGSLGAKCAKIAHTDVSASEGEKSTAMTGSHKKIVFTDDTEQEPMVSKSQGSDKGTECLELLQHVLGEMRKSTMTEPEWDSTTFNTLLPDTDRHLQDIDV